MTTQTSKLPIIRRNYANGTLGQIDIITELTNNNIGTMLKLKAASDHLDNSQIAMPKQIQDGSNVQLVG